MRTTIITISEDNLLQLVNLINIQHKRKLSRFTSKGETRPLTYFLERKQGQVTMYSLNICTLDSSLPAMILGDYNMADMYNHLHSFYQGLVSV